VYRNLSELTNLDDVGMLYLEFVVTEDKLGESLNCIYWCYPLCLNCFLRHECTAFCCCHRP
jgi:hypothetical protein